MCADITLSDVQEFSRRLLQGAIVFESVKSNAYQLRLDLYYVAFVHGNLSHAEAQKSLDTVTSILKAKPLDGSTLAKRSFVKLENGKNYIHSIKTFNPDDENSAVYIYYQVGYHLLPKEVILLTCT